FICSNIYPHFYFRPSFIFHLHNFIGQIPVSLPKAELNPQNYFDLRTCINRFVSIYFIIIMLKEKLKNHHIILASGSPRRHQFLKEMNIPFIVEHSSIKEGYPGHLKGVQISDYLAELKAKAFLRELK